MRIQLSDFKSIDIFVDVSSDFVNNMKTLVEKWNKPQKHSFIIKEIPLVNPSSQPQEVIMRMHDEYEISVIRGGSGKRIIGNSIQYLSETSMFFIGPNVPHSVQLDGYSEARAITIHFLPESFGNGFFDLPENVHISELLQQSARGIDFGNVMAAHYYNVLEELRSKISFDRMITFFLLLQELSQMPRKTLSSAGYSPLVDDNNYEKVNKIYQYVLNTFDAEEDVTLDEISSYVNMAPATFCRYFKKHFNKTFTCLLNEVRIGHACKMLQETDLNVAEIAFASGYNHLTHFNRQFKKFVGYSPKAYRQTLN